MSSCDVKTNKRGPHLFNILSGVEESDSNRNEGHVETFPPAMWMLQFFAERANMLSLFIHLKWYMLSVVS